MRECRGSVPGRGILRTREVSKRLKIVADLAARELRIGGYRHIKGGPGRGSCVSMLPTRRSNPCYGSISSSFKHSTRLNCREVHARSSWDVFVAGKSE
jgi:hypothetical protein